MNITVIGGGNIGTLMAAEAANKGHNVTVYTSKPYKWGNSIDVYDSDDNLLIRGVMSKITDNMEAALKDADYVNCPCTGFSNNCKENGSLCDKQAEDRHCSWIRRC